jgi:hypothetical protein
MAKCDLQILLDRPDRTYKFGEPISGAIKISTQEDFHCRKLTLIRAWKTEGRGNHASGGEEGMIFADEEEFKAGETKEYPFRFVGLAGPASYQGHYLSVDWYLRAQLDIPLTVDIKHEEKFFLIPGETSEKILLGVEEHLQDAPETTSALQERMSMAKVLAIPCLVIGLIMISVSGWYHLALAVGLALASFGGWHTFLLFRNILAQQKLGQVEVQILPEKLSAGEQVECRVLLPKHHAARLQKILATVKGEERVVSGVGNHKTSHTHTIHEYALEQNDSNIIPVENKMQFIFSLHIPDKAPSTFRAPDNALLWVIRVQLDIRDWPDWVQEFPVTVLP